MNNMNHLSEREIKDLLTPRERPVPPAELAERIKREIPADISVAPGVAGDVKAVSMPRSRVWLLAASVMMAVAGGFFAFRLMEQMPAPGAGSIQTAAEVPEPTAEAAERSDSVGTDDFARSVPASSTEELAAGSPAPDSGTPDSETLDAGTPAAATPVAGSPAGAGSGARARVPAEPVATAPGYDLPTPQSTSITGRLGAEGAARADGDVDAVFIDTVPVGEDPEPESHVSLPEAAVELEEPSAREPPRRQAKPIPPPASPRPPRAETPRPRARRENARIDPNHGNAQISAMREEARQLESELKALEESRPAAVAPPSTGGTAEPNDAPYGDVFFDSAGTNPFIDTEDDALSTFGLDVDTGSYTVARRYLRDGNLPPPEAVRVEEFINYFDYGDPAPEEAEFRIHAEGAPSIYGESESYHLLRFNLSGRELRRRDRRPALLTFVVDVSGSMARENRLGLVQQALALLIDQLRADDRLALVIYGSRGQVVLQPTGDHGAIRRAIERLRTDGATNVEEGLELAYELAARHRRRGAINRVILCSDGVANVGRTSAGSILERIRREADQGIELTTVGFGMGNYNDVLMEQLADTGNGRYAYVDTLDEARRIFALNLTGTLQTLAAEARVQVEFDPQTVSRYRLLGYENRAIADHRFRDPTVDAGEIGVGHKVTALYEIKLRRKPRERDRIATLRLRYGSVETRKTVEVERAVTGADFARRWESASPALKLTTLVAEYAEILKRAYWAREGDLEDVFRRAQRLSAQFEGDREVADFVSLVGRAAEYKKRERKNR